MKKQKDVDGYTGPTIYTLFECKGHRDVRFSADPEALTDDWDIDIPRTPERVAFTHQAREDEDIEPCCFCEGVYEEGTYTFNTALIMEWLAGDIPTPKEWDN